MTFERPGSIALTTLLSYETPHRIHSSATYPLTAPNGSEVVIYAHDRGLRILWRGGRRRKEREEQRQPHGTNGQGADVIVIDDSDDEAQEPASATANEKQYEDGENDGDEDSSYPDFIYDLDVNHASKVLHIAVPSITAAAAHQLPEIGRSHMIVAYACIDGFIGVMLISMHPPSEADKAAGSFQIHNQLVADAGGSISRDIAIRISQNHTDDRLHLMLATCGTTLRVWELSDSGEAGLKSQLCLNHPSPTKNVTFPSSRVQDQLMISDYAGNVRLYEFSHSRDNEEGLQESRDSISPAGRHGRWIISYHTPFLPSQGSPAMARRKNVLAAKFVLIGRGILVLLEDGEWGVWLLDPSQNANKNLQDFTLRGYLGEPAAEPPADARNQRKLGSKLAPMTPNTRKAKSEKLFETPPKAPGAASSGGIKVTPVTNGSGTADESIIIWYNNNIYTIPSMQSFWQRSSASNNTSGLGSLYTPGLTHVTDINLMNEQITAVSHFNTLESSGAQWERMNMRRNLLVSAEHRFIILHHLVPIGAQRAAVYEAKLAEIAQVQDQRMLDAGELDLGGMDRMLTSMADVKSGRAQRVGFAH